jgi:hypothetical protein
MDKTDMDGKTEKHSEAKNAADKERRRRLGEVLEEAGAATAQRGEAYGGPRPNMTAIARLWDAYVAVRLSVKAPDEPVVRPRDVPQMQILTKMGRTLTGGVDPDDLADEAGYADVTGQVVRDEEGGDG